MATNKPAYKEGNVWRDGSGKAIAFDDTGMSYQQQQDKANNMIGYAPQQPQPVMQQYAMPNYQDDLRNMYQDLINKQRAAAEATANQTISELDQQAKAAGPQYTGLKNQASLGGAKNLNAIKETLASMGLANSGDNVTAQTQARVGTENNINTLDQQYQDLLDKISTQKTNVKNSALTQADLEAAQLGLQQIKDIMSQANIDANRADQNYWNDKNYGLSVAGLTGYLNDTPTMAKQQQDTANSQWQKSFDAEQAQRALDNEYRAKAQQIQQTQWKSEFDRQSAQQALDNEYRNKTLALQQQQAEWDRQYKQAALSQRASSGGKSSGNYSPSQILNAAKNSFNNVMRSSNISDVYNWLMNNGEELKRDIGESEYAKMFGQYMDRLNQQLTQQGRGGR